MLYYVIRTMTVYTIYYICQTCMVNWIVFYRGSTACGLGDRKCRISTQNWHHRHSSTIFIVGEWQNRDISGLLNSSGWDPPRSCVLWWTSYKFNYWGESARVHSSRDRDVSRFHCMCLESLNLVLFHKSQQHKKLRYVEAFTVPKTVKH